MMICEVHMKTSLYFTNSSYYLVCGGGGGVQWLKLPTWTVRDRGLVPYSSIQVIQKK